MGTEQKFPVVLYDEDNPSIILFIVMVSDDYDASVVNNIVKDIKNKYPGEWTTEDILLEIMNNYPQFDIFNCQDIFRYGV